MRPPPDRTEQERLAFLRTLLSKRTVVNLRAILPEGWLLMAPDVARVMHMEFQRLSAKVTELEKAAHRSELILLNGIAEREHRRRQMEAAAGEETL